MVIRKQCVTHIGFSHGAEFVGASNTWYLSYKDKPSVNRYYDAYHDLPQLETLQPT